MEQRRSPPAGRVPRVVEPVPAGGVGVLRGCNQDVRGYREGRIPDADPDRHAPKAEIQEPEQDHAAQMYNLHHPYWHVR